jgi:hypothetical protein
LINIVDCFIEKKECVTENNTRSQYPTQSQHGFLTTTQTFDLSGSKFIVDHQFKLITIGTDSYPQLKGNNLGKKCIDVFVE